MSITLDPLIAALNPHGWYAEWKSNQDDDVRVVLYRPQGGQAHDLFEFDPSDPGDESPWGDEGAVHCFGSAINDPAVEKALFALCKACQ